MTIADLATLTERVKIAAICRDAGVSANTMQRRITRYRRGEQYPELSGEEQAALRGALERLRDEIQRAVG